MEKEFLNILNYSLIISPIEYKVFIYYFILFYFIFHFNFNYYNEIGILWIFSKKSSKQTGKDDY
jgi:hypothetical protein